MIRSNALLRNPRYALALVVAIICTASSSVAQISDPTRGKQPLMQSRQGGDLPPGVPSNPEAFRDSVRRLRLARGPEHDRARLGECSKPCLIDVEIRGLGEKVNDTSRSGIGRPVAHIVNKSKKVTEQVYHLKPNGEAEYYVWADKIPGSPTWRFTLLEVPRSKGGTVRNVSQKEVQRCPHPNEKYRTPDADFRDCDGRTARQASYYRHRYPRAFMFASAEEQQTQQVQLAELDYLVKLPWWTRCMSGCCY